MESRENYPDLASHLEQAVAQIDSRPGDCKSEAQLAVAIVVNQLRLCTSGRLLQVGQKGGIRFPFRHHKMGIVNTDYHYIAEVYGRKRDIYHIDPALSPWNRVTQQR